MNNFRNHMISPFLSICVGYVYIAILAIFLYSVGFYENSTFFTWGPPVTFMGTTIHSKSTYYLLLFLFFIHEEPLC